MKKIFLMCCLVVGFAAASHAQGGMRRSPEEQAKALQTQLKLTDDQTAKITSIFTVQAAKMDSVRTAANGDRQAMMSGMQPIRQAIQAKIAAVLTPEQAAAYKKIQDEQRAARMQNGGGGAPQQN